MVKLFFLQNALFSQYVVELFLCFPTVYNIPRVILYGSKDNWPNTRLRVTISPILIMLGKMAQNENKMTMKATKMAKIGLK